MAAVAELVEACLSKPALPELICRKESRNSAGTGRHRFSYFKAAADANADKTIDSLDVAAIQQHTVFMHGVIGSPQLLIDFPTIIIAAGDLIHDVKIRGRGDVKR